MSFNLLRSPRFVADCGFLASVCQIAVLFWMSASGQAIGEDWPGLRHDQRRSGVTGEQLEVRKLEPRWKWKSALPPSPAWPDAARWDAYATLDGLRSMRNYDPVFHAIVHGQRVFLPSNTDDTLRCLDLESGKEIWRFTADGPIRIAPSFHEDRIFFGCDSGTVYCTDLDGKLLWQKLAQENSQTFLNDGRICSFWPIRTGVLIDPDAGVGIAAAGMFPWIKTHLVAFELSSGNIRWSRDLGKGWSLEGAMLLSPSHIIIPQGRAAPQLFDRADGKPIGPLLEGGGGSFVLLTEDDQLLHGPGNKGGWITQSRLSTREKVVSFERGTAVVVDGSLSFLLDDQRLASMDRDDGAINWAVQCDCPHELIKAGDALFVGGNDRVEAFDANSGTLVWSASVDGRAFGLAVANGYLLVSTDTGSIHAFAPTRTEPVTLEVASDTDAGANVLNSENIENPSIVNDPNLMDRWVFHANLAEPTDAKKKQFALKSLAHSALHPNPAPLAGNAKFVATGTEQSMLLDGRTHCQISADINLVQRPAELMTALAWVRIDSPIAWGGILSMTQDNGSYEKGWILGYRDDRFGFAVNGVDGPDRLNWVISDKSRFVPGSWHMVSATYDGINAKLFVDGQLVGESDEQRGLIDYPANAFYQVAAYRDDDEFFVAEGMIHEVRLYDRALGAEEIDQIYQEKRDRFPGPASEAELSSRSSFTGLIDSDVTRGPIIDFVRPGVARVRWWTDSPQKSQIELQTHRDSKATVTTVTLGAAHLEHLVYLEPIRPHELLKFRITHQIDSQETQTGYFECDGHFDFNRAVLPASTLDASLQAIADQHIAICGKTEPRGLGIVIGAADDGKFAEAIARGANLDVVVLEADASLVATARRRLIDVGVYGRVISVRHLSQATDIGMPNRTADFVFVAPDRPSNLSLGDVSISDVLSKLQPGGTAIVPRQSLPNTKFDDDRLIQLTQDQRQRLIDASMVPSDAEHLIGYVGPKVAGAANWSHMYGTADNAAYAGETLSGAKSQEDFSVVWAGRPGPRYQSDRGNRKPSPLAASGRLYMQGLRRLICLDAFNGTVLWALELPEVLRFNVPRDCSNWCVDETNLYVAAKDRCYVIDSATGQLRDDVRVFDPEKKSFEWGYLSSQDELIIGSSVLKGTAFTEFWGGENWYDTKDGEHAKKVCSDILFASYKATGDMAWKFEDGLVVNPTITIADGKVYFLVSRAEKLAQQSDRRLDGPDFWNNMHMVALDAKTGGKVWDVPVKPMEGKSATYLAAADGKLVLTTSKDGAFGVYAIDATTGKPIWRGKFDWEVDHHGKHLSRPAIVEGKIYLRPLTLDLNTGAVLSQKFPQGHQCGTYTASRDALFLRAGELAIWDRASGESTRWDRARPDCWISTIPALGMLLSPEGGGGCSCGGWIETSIGFAPVARWSDH